MRVKLENFVFLEKKVSWYPKLPSIFLELLKPLNFNLSSDGFMLFWIGIYIYITILR